MQSNHFRDRRPLSSEVSMSKLNKLTIAIFFYLPSNALSQNIFDFIEQNPEIVEVSYSNIEKIYNPTVIGELGTVESVVYEAEDGLVRVSIDRFGIDHELDFAFLKDGNWVASNVSMPGHMHNSASRSIIRQVKEQALLALTNTAYLSRTYQITNGKKNSIAKLDNFPIELNISIQNDNGTLQLRQFNLLISELVTQGLIQKKQIVSLEKLEIKDILYVNQDGELLKIHLPNIELIFNYLTGSTNIIFKNETQIAGFGLARHISNNHIRRFSFSKTTHLPKIIKNYSNEIPTRVLRLSKELLSRSMCGFLFTSKTPAVLRR